MARGVTEKQEKSIQKLLDDLNTLKKAYILILEITIPGKEEWEYRLYYQNSDQIAMDYKWWKETEDSEGVWDSVKKTLHTIFTELAFTIFSEREIVYKRMDVDEEGEAY